MNHTISSIGSSQAAPRVSFQGGAEEDQPLHRESSESAGSRLRASGCGKCGNCTCGGSGGSAHEPEKLPAMVTERAHRPFTWLADRPWIMVTGAFALLVSVWTTFITLAVKNAPADIPVPPPSHVTGHH